MVRQGSASVGGGCEQAAVRGSYGSRPELSGEISQGLHLGLKINKIAVDAFRPSTEYSARSVAAASVLQAAWPIA